MSLESAFLQSLIDNPNDDASRLIYADWLDEHKEAERAGFLRLQVELDRLPADDPRRKHEVARQRHLFVQHLKGWQNAFLALLSEVPWLEHLGEPATSQGKVKQLRCWDEWPGPQEPANNALALYSQECYDELLDSTGPLRKAAEKLCKQIMASVLNLAKHKVPYDPKQDSWHGPTLSVWSVSWWAGLVVLYALLRREMPTQVRQAWSWIMAGHWPCGYKSGKWMVY